MIDASVEYRGTHNPEDEHGVQMTRMKKRSKRVVIAWVCSMVVLSVWTPKEVAIILGYPVVRGGKYNNLERRMSVGVTMERSLDAPVILPKNGNVRLGRGKTSSVALVGPTVVKKATHFQKYNLIEREVCVLQRLQQFPWAPQLLKSSNDTITMTYVGQRVTKTTLPTDYATQFDKILNDMESVGVRHNDIIYPCLPKSFEKHESKSFKKHEVMVHDGRLSLVDFGWSTIDGGVPCNVSKHLFKPKWTPCKDSTMMKVLNGMAGSVRLAVGATMRNEGPYIVEWIDFHLQMGVERFYIADNDSTDDSLTILHPYILRGVVTLVQVINTDNQIKTYNQLLKTAKIDGVEWLCFIDIDEFMYPGEKGDTLIRILSRFNATVGAVGVPRLNFDHNGVMVKSDNSVLQRFTHRRRHDSPFNGAVARSSSIIRVDSVLQMKIHNPTKMRDGTLFVDVEGKVMPLGPHMHGKQTPAPPNGSIRMNHYYCKSHEEFSHKNRRNKLWGSKLTTWDVRCVDSWNDGVYDTTILQHVLRRQRTSEAHLFVDYNNKLSHHMLVQVLPPTISISKVWAREGIHDDTTRFKLLKMFYGVPVRDSRFAQNHTIYLLKDTAPFYSIRTTTKGNRRVNVGIFDTKKHFRKQGLLVHATDNIQETRDNMNVLNLDYPSEPKFETMENVFRALNADPSFSYVVLRNFEGLPMNVAVDEHFDLDLLVSDYYVAKRILDAESTTGSRYEDGKGRIQNRFKVGDTWVQADIRFVGDDYYDESWERAILDTRIKFNDLVYVSSITHYKYSLLYHAVVQKPSVSTTYKNKMQELFGEQDLNKLKQRLTMWLSTHEYRFTRPSDKSVFFRSLE